MSACLPATAVAPPRPARRALSVREHGDERLAPERAQPSDSLYLPGPTE